MFKGIQNFYVGFNVHLEAEWKFNYLLYDSICYLAEKLANNFLECRSELS